MSATEAPGLRKLNRSIAAFERWAPDVPRPEDVIAGEVDMQISVFWRSADGRNATGMWTCQPMTIHLDQPFQETLLLVEGHVSYTPEAGEPIHLHPGDAIVMERGAKAIFQVHEPALTFWSIDETEPIAF
ncbi:cupin domain-containing protein [Capillimicrobium parvum]|uniref:(S)-ureidoglycine aminohydrolase cupin domain-containing protein n=1 Tax=Capillimicrobium parvum TaxID=2884022 RepID=A0A9E7C132_9ACTN|nr:cupin domain-containing protein [Capillimicrobium parvum]UGS36013.1 hypothetical protein DSM104329_02410 [Capillimicrobium parvum]